MSADPGPAVGDAFTIGNLEVLRRLFREAEVAALTVGPVYLPPWLYDEADCAGYDMRGYAKTALIPEG